QLRLRRRARQRRRGDYAPDGRRHGKRQPRPGPRARGPAGEGLHPPAGPPSSGNPVAEPGYADRTVKDFTLRPDSPCLPTISGALWQPFRDDSIWNIAALQKGFATADNPYADQFASYSRRLEISGIPGSGSGIQDPKRIFFAKG